MEMPWVVGRGRCGILSNLAEGQVWDEGTIMFSGEGILRTSFCYCACVPAVGYAVMLWDKPPAQAA